jgi:hypothetical protein
MRVEVIDSVEGRIITRYAADVKIELQDDGKTMKVFISPMPVEPSVLDVPMEFGASFKAIYTDRAGHVIEVLGQPDVLDEGV